MGIVAALICDLQSCVRDPAHQARFLQGRTLGAEVGRLPRANLP
jgi:hypothetical protein